jgi:restriction system protein
MLPLLETARDGNERSMSDFRDALAEVFGLSAEEREELLPSGTQPVFTNRVAWACVYLQRAGLLERPRRGRYRITERGSSVLKEKPGKIDIKYLQQFPEFIKFREIKKQEKGKPDENDEEEKVTSPEETLESAYQELKHNLATDIVQTLKDCSSQFFEGWSLMCSWKWGMAVQKKRLARQLGGRAMKELME